MKTYSFLNKTFVVLLCSVLAFVCVARPLQVRADTASMDYVETDMSTADVKSLFTGASAIVPAAIMIIGFIVMCYCVLRNVEVPLNFSSQASFTDKLTQLGQYAIDNATDDIKDFLYSVYTYCDDNGITSVLGLSKFVALQAAKFFGAITNWIGGSLIIDRTDIGEGIVDSFSGNSLALLTPKFSYFSDLASVFPYNFSIYNTIGYVYATTFNAYYTFYTDFNLNYYAQDINCVLIYNSQSRLMVSFYHYDGSNLLKRSVLCNVSSFQFANTTNQNVNVSPNRSTYTPGSYSATSFNFDITYNTTNAFVIENIISFVQSFGLPFYFSSVPLTNTVSPSSVSLLRDVINPASDNVYVPTDVWNIDIVGTWEQIADAQDRVLTQTEKIAAFVGSIPLTLTAADSYAPTINDAGNYVFPDFGSVWKYPQYFFDTLSGWGMFVGNCLRAVTVDEGGLSWIFYGGFVLLVCGGIIGKILMG